MGEPAAPERPRVVVIGPVNMDLFIRGDAPLDRDALNAWVDTVDVQLLAAGSIGYTVQVFAKLGDAVEACTTVGDDAFGTYLRQTLEARGVDCRGVVEAHGETAIGIYMMLFGGLKRPLAIRLPGFEPWPDPPFVLDPGEPPPALVHSGGLLHFADMWHRGQAAAFRAARSAGAWTSIDPQFPLVATPAPWLPHVADVVAEADVLLCDELEARMLFDVATVEAAIPKALEAGPRIVAIKRGAEGAVIADRDGSFVQPPVAVDPSRVREAVGAGDAFDAGFLDTLVRGGGVDDAARFGTAAAAVSLSGRGGAEAIAGRDAVVSRLTDVPAARRLDSAAR
jgi:sugar/nucleoside kinase (ribokinase family)